MSFRYFVVISFLRLLYIPLLHFNRCITTLVIFLKFSIFQVKASSLIIKRIDNIFQEVIIFL